MIRQATDGTLYYRPVVAFTLPDGAHRMLQLTEESSTPAYEVDESVTIAYDPDPQPSPASKPPQARRRCGSCPLITGILGVAFLGAALFARRVLRSGDEYGAA